MEKEKSKYKDYMSKFKDIIFIITIIISAIGWISTSISKKYDMKNALENNTKAIEELKIKVDKIDDYINQQSELNGKIINFMDMIKSDKNNKVK